MKTVVIYSSHSGNTKKLAKAVYEAIEGEKEIYPIEDAPDPANYDFLAVGFWVQAGKPDAETLKYLPKIINRKDLFLFATHGGSPDSDHVRGAIQYAIELASSAKIIGTFNCQGEVSPEFMKKISEKPKQPVWIDNAPNAVGHPDEVDIENLKNSIRSIKLGR